MKKPPFIEVQTELKKGTLSPAVKKYFKKLENKTLKVNFAEFRSGKTFSYEVRNAGPKRIWDWEEHDYKDILSLELRQVVPEKDQKKIR